MQDDLNKQPPIQVQLDKMAARDKKTMADAGLMAPDFGVAAPPLMDAAIKSMAAEGPTLAGRNHIKTDLFGGKSGTVPDVI